MQHETAVGKPSLIVDMNVVEYFKDSLNSALSRQRLKAEEDTVFYVVNLLAWYVRAENLSRKPRTAWASNPWP